MPQRTRRPFAPTEADVSADSDFIPQSLKPNLQDETTEISNESTTQANDISRIENSNESTLDEGIHSAATAADVAHESGKANLKPTANSLIGEASSRVLHAGIRMSHTKASILKPLTVDEYSYRRPSQMSDELLTRLQTKILEDGITNTFSLISRINDSPAEERHVLIKDAVEAYAAVIRKLDEQFLSLIQLQEFMMLNQLAADSREAKAAMIEWLALLIEKSESGHAQWVRALNDALLTFDVDILDGNPDRLVQLAQILLKKLTSIDGNDLIAATTVDTDIINALFGILRIVKRMGDDAWDSMTEGGTLYSVKMKIDEVVAVSEDFITLHHAKQIQQGIIHLESEATQMPIQTEITITHQSSMVDWSFPRWTMLADGEVGLKEDIVAKIDEALSKDKHWVKWLRLLDASAQSVFKNADVFETYIKHVGYMMTRDGGKRLAAEDCKHLEYGIMEQLTVLIAYGSSAVRTKIQQHLDDFISKMGDASNAQDPNLRRLRHQCKDMLRETHRDKGGPSQDRPSHQDFYGPATQTLFSLVASHLKEDNEDDIEEEVDWMEYMPESLRIQCRLKFVQVKSMGGVDISTLRFHLMRNERRDDMLRPDNAIEIGSCKGREVVPPEFKTGMELSDLFPEEGQMSRALVVGMPGVGKTHLAQRLVVDWADGLWGQQFQSVFLLPVHALLNKEDNIAQNNPTLSQAIVKSCFDHRDDTVLFDNLCEAVDEALTRPNTLLIVDGLDEAQKDKEGILSAAMDASNVYKLLVLSRPNLKDIGPVLQTCDLVAELDGLRDEDVKEYLSTEHADVRLRLEENPRLWGLAHCPRQLEILRRILQPPREREEDENPSMSLTSIFSNLIEGLWLSKSDRPDDRSTDMVIAFKQLEKMAYRCLRSGRCWTPLQENDFDVSLLVESGFVVINIDGNAEFIDYCTMKFFAARYMTRSIMGTEDNNEDVEEYIESMKYAPESQQVMTLVAGVLGRMDDGDVGIRKLLEIVDAGNVELLGLQHLKLKTAFIEEWLREVGRWRYLELEKESGVLADAVKWLKKGIGNIARNQCCADGTFNVLTQMIRSSPEVMHRCRADMLDILLKAVRTKHWNVIPSLVSLMAALIDLDPDDIGWQQAFREAQMDPNQSMHPNLARCIGAIGRCSTKAVPQLLSLLRSMRQISRSSAYCSSFVELLRRAPECLDEDIENLMDACEGMDYWMKANMLDALPEILKEEQYVHRLIAFVLPPEAVQRQLSVCAIQALGRCIEVVPSCTTEVVDQILGLWKKMSEDEIWASARTLIKAARMDSNKAIQIVEDLLSDEDDAPWPRGYTLLKATLSVLQEMSSNVDIVFERLMNAFSTKVGDLYVLCLILEGIKFGAKVSTDVIQKSTAMVLTTFGNTEWSVRSMAYDAAGSIARYHSSLMSIDFIEAVVGACKEETVWKARCSAFTAAEEIASTHNHGELLLHCRETLGDSDDEIRRRAAHVLKSSIAEKPALRKELTTDLVRSYDASDDNAKHGIVYCLHLLLHQFPETASIALPVFLRATDDANTMLSVVGVSALLLIVQGDVVDAADCVETLERACRRTEARIRYVALDALSTRARRNPDYLKLLIPILKVPMRPLNDREWHLYFAFMAQATVEARVENLELLKALAEDRTHVSAFAQKEQKSAIDGMSLKLLLDWYELTHYPFLIPPILERLHRYPVTIKKIEDDDKWVEILTFREFTTRIQTKTLIDLIVHIRGASINSKFTEAISFFLIQGFASLGRLWTMLSKQLSSTFKKRS